MRKKQNLKKVSLIINIFITLGVIGILNGIITNMYITQNNNIQTSKKELKTETKQIKLAQTDTNTPIITNITELQKSSNTIKIQVETQNADGATYEYYYKKSGDKKYTKAGESKNNTFTYNELEANETYEIRTKITKNTDTVEKEIQITTEKIVNGAIKFENFLWDKEGENAKVTITSGERDYSLEYKIEETGEWIRDSTARNNNSKK